MRKMLKNLNGNKIYKLMDKISYVYMILPYLIFFCGWVKTKFAIPLVGILVVILLRAIFSKRESTINMCDKMLECDKKTVFMIAAIIILWVAMSGIGKVSYQTDDHIWRNGLFETLVNQQWPVIDYESGRGMSYYIAFLLPAACVGKVFGINIGYKFQIIWAVIGVCLFYFYICKIIKKVAVWPLLVFILFSGLDIIGELLVGNNQNLLFSPEHLEWWAGQYQFSSHTTQLFWVFNQAIPAWLAVAMILCMGNNKKILLVWSCLVLYSTYPFIGMLAIAPFVIMQNSKKNNYGIKEFVQNILTVENTLGAGIIFIVSFLYLSRAGDSMKLGITRLSNGGWLIYIVFILIEVGCYFWIIYDAQKNNILYYSSLAWLLMCPLLNIYGEKNFCMRASIPALVILYLLLIETILKCKEKKKLIVIGMLLCIGSITPMHEVIKTVSMNKKAYVEKNVSISQRAATYEEVMSNEYETVDIKGSVFFKYIAK